jgi:hypothetical protein
VREIPGFFAIGVILLILFIREQVLAIVSLILLGAATAITAQFPSLGGLLVRDAAQFHRLPLLRDGEPVAAAAMAGQEEGAADARLASVGGIGATLLAYLLIVVTWRAYDLSYDLVYWAAGG